MTDAGQGSSVCGDREAFYAPRKAIQLSLSRRRVSAALRFQALKRTFPSFGD
jgi:hypothetical protein